jgi:hypothetical protein
MLCNVAESFVHAAGLFNDEHTLDDVFCYPAELQEGQTAADDRLHPWGGLAGNMPPYVLSSKTVTNLQSLWP